MVLKSEYVCIENVDFYFSRSTYRTVLPNYVVEWGGMVCYRVSGSADTENSTGNKIMSNDFESEPFLM